MTSSCKRLMTGSSSTLRRRIIITSARAFPHRCLHDPCIWLGHVPHLGLHGAWRRLGDTCHQRQARSSGA